MEPTQEPRRERFNVSRWALEHAPLTRYLMVVLMVLGCAAYFQLGQDEDPPFTFKAMVIQTQWPGATAEEVSRQVTERIWLVSFMEYDLGSFDDETCRLEPIDNPFRSKVLPMAPE